MDRKELAKKIREAIFNRIEEDRAIHASSIEQEVEKVLGAMSISHYPGRGAGAPVPETYTLTLPELPACTHNHVSWTNDGIPTATVTPALEAAFRAWGEQFREDLARNLFG